MTTKKEKRGKQACFGGSHRRNKKVIVAMSGGVDSSTSAVLLKRAGFDVAGVFMKLNDFSSAAEKRARKVAKILKIPFYVLNFKKEFKKRVVDCFLTEYKKGLTPNPCVVCNKEIKFGLLLQKTSILNADFVATGHYAKIRKRPDGVSLLKGKDKEKDQSYFLWKLNQKQLKRILLPVGNHAKTEIRKMAKKFRLPSAETPESQEICFIKDSVDNFLKRHIKEKPGKIINIERKVLGRHRGLWFYTIGQRKGIGLSGGPFYVLDKDLKKNLLIVTKNPKDLLKKELSVREVNWISGKSPKLPLKVKAKIRYRTRPASGKIYKSGKNGYRILFEMAQRAVTPGQSVAFFKGQELLGGGIIC